MEFIRLSKNVHKVDCIYNRSSLRSFSFLLLSDLHFDNPHCQRELLIKHLDFAKENDYKILVNGDFFCCMQGKFDPRRSKSNIRPEHNKSNYLDAIISDAVNFFSPYKDQLKLIGYGNHETAILKNLETDLLQRFADLFNHKNNVNVQVGGYGGWVIFQFKDKHNAGSKQYRLKYFHGAGGGGPVTKGVIQNQRMMAQTQGADCIWMGHVHEMYTMYHTVETLNQRGVIQLKDILHVRTSSYKEEYNKGYMDFHVERGRPPKPIGSYLINLELSPRNEEKLHIIATTTALK